MGTGRLITILLTATTLAVAGCTAANVSHVPIKQKHEENIVHLDGMGDIRFGAKKQSLVKQKLVAANGKGCDGEPQFDIRAHKDETDLVFDSDDRLALIWIYAPSISTPDHIRVGSTIATVQRAWPKAESLPATDTSHPGLLATEGERGILFLYEPQTKTVVKILAGYVNRLRDAHSEGLTC